LLFLCFCTGKSAKAKEELEDKKEILFGAKKIKNYTKLVLQYS
jgi:hypothetical protein